MTTQLQVEQLIFGAISRLRQDPGKPVTHETVLIGEESDLDSMALVELCLELEDIAGGLEFEFDWTSEAAMSRSRSMFRTAGTLAAEFMSQMTVKTVKSVKSVKSEKK